MFVASLRGDSLQFLASLQVALARSRSAGHAEARGVSAAAFVTVERHIPGSTSRKFINWKYPDIFPVTVLSPSLPQPQPQPALHIPSTWPPLPSSRDGWAKPGGRAQPLSCSGERGHASHHTLHSPEDSGSTHTKGCSALCILWELM